MTVAAPNIPNPDPSEIANQRMDALERRVNDKMDRDHGESKGWIEALQELLEDGIKSGDDLLREQIRGGLENIKTRLDGNDTAIVAALKAQKEEAAKQTENFKEILGEIKVGIAKQFESMFGQIEDLKKAAAIAGGKSQGKGEVWAMIIAVIAAVTAIIAVGLSLSDRANPPQPPPISGRI